MRLTTKGRYGLRLVLDIAQHEKWGPVSMAETALRQDISAKYLERLVGELQRAGIIKSLRGRDGGHMLALPPEKISVGEIVRVLEGGAASLACCSNRSACPRSENCLTRPIWIAADEAMFARLDTLTVQDILNAGANTGSEPKAAADVAGVVPALVGSRTESFSAADPRRIYRRRAARRLPRPRGIAGKPTKSVRRTGTPPKILVVDDDPDIAGSLVNIFRRRGYATCTAANGAEALKMLLREGPDLIALDPETPGEWGQKFQERLPHLRHIPVVVLKGLTGSRRPIAAMPTRDAAFKAEDVLRAVENAIGAPGKKEG